MSCESRTALYSSVGTMGFCIKKQHPHEKQKNSLAMANTMRIGFFYFEQNH